MDSVNLDISRLPNKDFNVSITGLKRCFLFNTALFCLFLSKRVLSRMTEKSFENLSIVYKYALHFSTFLYIFVHLYVLLWKIFNSGEVFFLLKYPIWQLFPNRNIFHQQAHMSAMSKNGNELKKRHAFTTADCNWLCYSCKIWFILYESCIEYLLDVHLADVWPLDAHKCSLIGFAWLNQTSWLKATR